MAVIESVVRFISKNPGSAVQIVFSGVLALATIAYTFATFRQISEMRTDREMRNRPILKPTIANRHTLHHFFAVENTGEGAAYDVEAEWWADKDDKHTWKIPLLSPGERRTFPLPFGDEDRGTVSASGAIEEVAGGGSNIEFRVSYEDSLGNKYSPEETPDVATASIDVLDTIESREEASEYVDQKPIKTIADEMEEVTDQLESIGKSIEMEHIDARAKDEIYERVLDEIREERVVTFRDLVNSLGINSRLLSELLHEMLHSGKIEYDEDYAGYFFKNALDAKIEYVDDAENV